MRLDEPAAAYLNWQLLAGTYPDAKVRPWTFTADGHTTWPDRSFAYEVSIDESKADCDYVFFAQPGEVGGYRRYGFRRAKGTLRLYSIAYLKNGAAPIHCDKVIAELRSGRSSWSAGVSPVSNQKKLVRSRRDAGAPRRIFPYLAVLPPSASSIDDVPYSLPSQVTSC